MRISDKTYDLLKWLAIYLIPALETLWLTIALAWNLPYTEPIGITIGAIGIFIATCIGISTKTYKAELKAIREEEDNS